MSNQTNPQMALPPAGVKIRMYRPNGLGDCFLLNFRTTQDQSCYMLIDCGVFMGTEGGSAQMKKIAQDIKTACGGRLDILVVTHEHWDHFSGFQYAKDIFQEIKIENLWLAWTEDLTHPLARQLHEKRDAAFAILTMALNRFKAAGDSRTELIQELFNFNGEMGATIEPSGLIARLKKIWPDLDQLKYCRPGEPIIELPGVAGIKIYVLGPPQEEELLTRSNPSTVNSEVYERGVALNETTAFYGALLASAEAEDLSLDEAELLERSHPFDPGYRIPLDKAAAHADYGDFFQDHYGFSSQQKKQGPAWRRIDVDWLGAAGPLALKLDSDTNNTSLVLAIELEKSSKVLLFPGDAQVGNWLSWQQVSWSGSDGGSITGADLLKHTVLYKVGHHGSHNATLRQMGLELMQDPNLVALVPVNEEQAKKKKWSMPFPPLYERLQEKTAGRILRADGIIPQRPDSVSQDQWNDFLGRIVEDPGPDKLWIEYTVE